VCFFAVMEFVSLHLIIRDSQRKYKNLCDTKQTVTVLLDNSCTAR